jgi:Domain of unknown function (DUF6443)
LKSGITTEDQIRSLTAVDKVTSFNYMDGAGRPQQGVVAGRSAQLNDIIQVPYYDGYGRSSRQYLPFATTALLPGSFLSQPLTTQSSFYNNANDKVRDDSRRLTTRPLTG